MLERRTRPDRDKAIAVNAGIAMKQKQGREAAALFLEDAGLPLAVIARVLNDAEQRRAGDLR
ncbi:MULTISPECIES: hypothetical protein [unclassified Duganella]|jgi:hypothetical protein|uniref:hypothetical protein n=1 Tax=unclassified Duganella TaxID=2636909 RepID=UPI00087F12AA|nr:MULTISPECIES: hypothetical protein [unclassified Duganella]SDF95504.1 hypothetical protein SAMN05216320_102159 [Duganella sp. OV458]SDJ09214.1 hypothetical protein SAMN05428973_102392 [Duganella sp. OV510]